MKLPLILLSLFLLAHLHEEVYGAATVTIRIIIIIIIAPGKEVNLQMSPGETICDIKVALSSETKIPAYRMSLYMDKKELDNKAILSELGMKDKTSLVLVLDDEMLLTIKKIDDEEFNVVVQSSGSIGDIKTKIQQQEGILKDHIRLSCHGQELYDHEILDDCTSKGPILMELKDEILLTIKSKFKGTFQMIVQLTMSICEVKHKIEQLYGWKPYDIRLLFNNKELMNRNTLKDLGIVEDAELVLKFKNEVDMTIQLENGKEAQMTAMLNSKVSAVIAELEKINVNMKDKCLIYNNQLLMVDKTLEHYIIPDGAVLSIAACKQDNGCATIFEYKGKMYKGCTSVDSSKPWCSLDAVYNGNYIYCEIKEDCVPKFQYKGQTYTGCTSADSSKPWCSLDAVYNGNYIYCEIKEDCVPKFQYKGQIYTGCTSADSSKPWCSLDAVYNGRYKYCEIAADCAFPFNYDGKTYKSCTKVDSSKFWCSLDTDYQKKYKYCEAEDFPKPASCKFPFTYESKTYNHCTDDDSSSFWCSEDATYNKKYIYC